MSEEKRLKARVVHKHKTYAEWYLDVYDESGKLRSNPFIPLNGELIIFDPDENCVYRRKKYGDGISNVMELSFAEEIYVGDGDMPENATIQITLDGEDEPGGVMDDVIAEHNMDTTAHADIREKIIQLSSKITDSVPDYVLTEAEEVANKVLSVRNALSFVFGAISDIHSTGSDISTLHAGQGIREIDKLTTLDACLNFGDGIDSYFESVNTDSFLHIHRCLHSIRREIPYIQMQGNHDQLKTDTTEDARQKYFAYIGANNIGTVTDWDNRFRNYGYRDFPDQRMRVIYLNSVDVSEGENTDDCWLTAMQLSWLVNTALDFTDKNGWSFIVGCHHPLNWWYMDNLLAILNAYKGKASGSVTVDGTTVDYDFTNATAEFIAHFHGHLHNFRVETLGSNGVLSITIPNACFGRNNEYGTSSSYTDDIKANYGDVDENGEQRQFNKTTGTAEDTAFNIVVIDRDNEKIHCFNYGAGIDREIDFTGNVVVPDEPVIPDEPVVPDEPAEIVNILKTIGYTDGKRCRTSGVTLGDLTGATAFGWYDCSNLTETDVIRIYLPNGVPETEESAFAAHCTSADETTSVSMAMYTQSSLTIFKSMFDDVSYSNNIITLTGRDVYDTSRTKFRLSAMANGADCIMTLNQEIVL